MRLHAVLHEPVTAGIWLPYHLPATHARWPHRTQIGLYAYDDLERTRARDVEQHDHTGLVHRYEDMLTNRERGMCIDERDAFRARNYVARQTSTGDQFTPFRQTEAELQVLNQPE